MRCNWPRLFRVFFETLIVVLSIVRYTIYKYIILLMYDMVAIKG